MDARTLTRLTGGQIRFRVNGAPGLTVKLMASTNLTTWTQIATQTLTAPTWDFTDTAAGTFPKRFYKAVAGP